MIEANRLKLGIFVTICLVLLIISAFALGLFGNFKATNKFFTIFDESVQGLEKGAAIKYKGVTVGRVYSISIWNDRYVKVEMETDPDSVIGGGGLNKPSSRFERIKYFNEHIQKEVNKGLRCSLELSSIATGLKFIELTHLDVSRETEVKVNVDLEDKARFVPAMKSLLSGAINNFDKTLNNIAKIDYQGLGDEAKTLLINLNKITSDAQVQLLFKNGAKAIEDFSTITQNLKEQLKGLNLPEIQKVILKLSEDTNKNISDLTDNTDKNISKTLAEMNKNFENTLKNFDSFINSLNEELKAAKIAELSKTSNETMANLREKSEKILNEIENFTKQLTELKKDASKTLQSIEGAANSLSGMRGDIATILKRFKVTLDSINSFVEYLEKDPASLIHGKAQDKKP